MMSRPVNILALVTGAFGGGGGIAQYNRDFITALTTTPGANRIEVLPRITNGPVGELPPNVRQRPPIHSQLGYSIRAVAVAVAKRPDTIICGHLFMAPLAALIARCTGAKLVVQTHGVEVWPRPKRPHLAGLEAADLVLCVSRDTRARVINWASIAPDRVVVVPNTVSEVYAPGDGSGLRTELGLQDKIVLLSISRLDASQQYKGQDRVIPLLKRLRAKGHDAVFVIGGSGGDRARLESLAREKGVENHVRFLGEVPNAQLPGLYRAADLYLMPSSGEGFGIVFLEAMASGTPALGLALGGATDALVDGDAVDETELERALAQRLAAPRPDPVVLAAKVHARFGRPVFQDRVAKAMGRLIAPDQAIAA